MLARRIKCHVIAFILCGIFGAAAHGATSTTVNPPVITRPGGSDPTITTMLGMVFDYTLATTGDGLLSFKFGTLPTGITAKGNKLSGTPTVTGTFPVAVTVSSSAGSDKATLTITIVSTPLAGTLKMKETYKDTLKTFHEEGGSFADQFAFSTYSLQATITPDAAITFTKDTEFSISFGDVNFTSTLGKAQKFAEGKGATFLVQIDVGDNAPKLITLAQVKISNSDKKLTISASGKGSDLIDGAQNFVLGKLLNSTTAISAHYPCVIRFGSAAAAFDVLVTGDVPKKTDKTVGSGENSDTFTLISASVKGEGTATK